MPIKAILRLSLFAILSFGTIACSTTSGGSSSMPSQTGGSMGGGY